jgi:predicted RND superfamily exporter protein
LQHSKPVLNQSGSLTPFAAFVSIGFVILFFVSFFLLQEKIVFFFFSREKKKKQKEKRPKYLQHSKPVLNQRGSLTPFAAFVSMSFVILFFVSFFSFARKKGKNK